MLKLSSLYLSQHGTHPNTYSKIPTFFPGGGETKINKKPRTNLKIKAHNQKKIETENTY